MFNAARPPWFFSCIPAAAAYALDALAGPDLGGQGPPERLLAAVSIGEEASGGPDADEAALEALGSDAGRTALLALIRIGEPYALVPATRACRKCLLRARERPALEEALRALADDEAAKPASRAAAKAALGI